MKGGFTLIFHKFHPFFTELNCRKCTNRTSPECPKHPMHTITLHSRIKFSRLDSNQRPFVYQTKTLNHLSYVRMLARLQEFESWPNLLERFMQPLHHRRVFPNMSKNLFVTPKKNPELFCSSGFLFYIWWYAYISLRTLTTPKSCPLIADHDWPTVVGRLLTLCIEFCFIVSN